MEELSFANKIKLRLLSLFSGKDEMAILVKKIKEIQDSYNDAISTLKEYSAFLNRYEKHVKMMLTEGSSDLQYAMDEFSSFMVDINPKSMEMSVLLVNPLPFDKFKKEDIDRVDFLKTYIREKIGSSKYCR